VKLSRLQLRSLARCVLATHEGRWHRAIGSGERVTLASLHKQGLLERRVWKQSESAAARGDYASPAHEYQVTDAVLAAARETIPRLRA
jgi:hypothetical protein